MYNVILNHNDNFETVLPVVEKAMACGEVCRVMNLSYLGQFDCASQTLASMTEELLDGFHKCRIQPGFKLLGVDERGITRTLLI
jgi:hypothetical protein